MAQRRPDLENAAFKKPNYLTDWLMPGYGRATKAGTYYFDDILADQTAQTDRTLASAPTAVAIASASDTFSLSEKIKRYKIDDSEIVQCGGLMQAQMKMARRGKRAVFDDIEALTIAATFGDTANITTVDIGASLIGAVATAVETLQDYAEGNIILFGAQKIINRVKRYTEIATRMNFPNVIVEDAGGVRNIGNQQLATVLGVDYVIGGPSTASAKGWLGAASAYDGYLGLMVMPNATADPLDELQFGRIFHLEQSGINSEGGNFSGLFKCETFYSDDLKSEVCDTQAFVGSEVFNKELCYILTGCDEGNTVTTTAS